MIMQTTLERATTETGGMPILLPILTVTEQAVLLECEAIIRQGRAVFVNVGHALTRIRDSRLYREKYSTFEEYCLEEWEISDRFARNLRSAADVVHVLEEKKFSVLPATESQARPLTKLPREEWSPAWEEVVGTAPNGRVTAGHVTNVVQRRVNRLAGLSSDTEVIQKPKAGSRKPVTIDAGTRDGRITAAHESALAKLQELQDLVRGGDLGAVHVNAAINSLLSSQEHFHAVRRLKDNVEKSQGLRPEYVKQKQAEITKP
jgi:hypothetical protein